MSERRRLLGDLSWFQVIAGALAAMTAAWLASALGVAGTIIGAAVASLTVTITSAFYARTLDKSRVLVVRTERGTTIERAIEPGETEIALAEIGAQTEVKEADVEEVPARRLHWKTIGLTSLLVLVLSFGAMGIYEVATGDSYGSSKDNAKIGNPFGGGSSGSTDEDDEPVEEDTTPTPSATTPAPSPTQTTPTPTETTPTPTEPTPTPTATETAPAS